MAETLGRSKLIEIYADSHSTRLVVSEYESDVRIGSVSI